VKMMKLLLLSLLFVGILSGGNGIVNPQVTPIRHIGGGLRRGRGRVHLRGIVQRIRNANLKIGQLRALRGRYGRRVVRGRMSRRHVELRGLRVMLNQLRARLRRELATEDHIVHLSNGKLRSAGKLFYAMQTKLRQSQSLFMSAKRGLASAVRHRNRARAHVNNEMMIIDRILLMLTGFVTRSRRGLRRGIKRGLRRGRRGLRRVRRPFVRRAASTLSVKSGMNAYQPAGSGSVTVTPPTTLSVSSKNVFSAPQQAAPVQSASGSGSNSDDDQTLDEEDTLDEDGSKSLNEATDLLEIEEEVKPVQPTPSTGSSSPAATASASV